MGLQSLQELWLEQGAHDDAPPPLFHQPTNHQPNDHRYIDNNIIRMFLGKDGEQSAMSPLAHLSSRTRCQSVWRFQRTGTM